MEDDRSALHDPTPAGGRPRTRPVPPSQSLRTLRISRQTYIAEVATTEEQVTAVAPPSGSLSAGLEAWVHFKPKHPMALMLAHAHRLDKLGA